MVHSSHKTPLVALPAGRILALAALLLVFSNAVCLSADTTAHLQIVQAIRQLGDDDFAAREAASMTLRRAGVAAETLLEEAAHSSDPEVAARAKGVLLKFQRGFYPHTSDIARERLKAYHAQPQRERQLMEWLAQDGQYFELIALIRHYRRPEKIPELAKEFLDGVAAEVSYLLAKGEAAAAAALLERAAISPEHIRNWAAFQVSAGRAVEQRERLQRRLRLFQGAPESKQQLQWSVIQLAYLQRASGDLDGACKTAAQLGDQELFWRLNHEARKWQALSDYVLRPDSSFAADAVDSPFGDWIFGDDINRLGYMAAWHRLAGRADHAARTLQRVKTLAEPTNLPFPHAEALLLNGEYESSIELFSRSSGLKAFQMRVHRQQFRQAFATAGVQDLAPPITRWFDNLVDDPEQQLVWQHGPAKDRFMHGLAVARQLHALGEPDEAEKLFQLLELAASENCRPDDRRTFRGEVNLARCKLGNRQAGLKAVEAMLAENHPYQAMEVLYGRERRSAAIFILKVIRRQSPEATTAEALKQLELWMAPDAAERVAEDWEELAKAAIDTVQHRKAKEYELHRLAEVCRDREAHSAELLLLKQFAQSRDHVYQRGAGVCLMREQQWAEAVQWFEQLEAINASRVPTLRTDPFASKGPHRRKRNTPAIYLHGYALTRLNKVAAGEKKMKLAELMLLSDEEARSQLAEILSELGIDELAHRQFQIVARTAEIDCYLQRKAAERIDPVNADADPLAAARQDEEGMLGLFNGSYFPDPANYLKLPSDIHFVRGKEYLRRGEIDVALRECDLALQASPGRIDVPCQVVPVLQAQHQHEAAQRLFDRVFAVHQQVCRDFPRSAHNHDQAARLAAACRLRLTDGLKHARQAVAVEPDNADYLGTLAEVHFAIGERQTAIELMQQCIKLAPKQEKLRQRLSQFRQQADVAESAGDTDSMD